MMDLTHLARSMTKALMVKGSDNGQHAPALRPQPAQRGDIHQTFRCSLHGREWFIKWGGSEKTPLLNAEAQALQVLADCGAISVPEPLCCDADEDHCWLVLPFIDLRGHGNTAALGRALATLHRCTQPRHGWPSANYIGYNLQTNEWKDHWPDFWWQCRLAPQLELARRKGYGDSLGDLESALQPLVVELLDHGPPPSLLHGDLWAGNHGYGPNGEPWIFDPASYYGDRETDLAMMRLFGGFAGEVFDAYEQAWPLPQGHERRRLLYQLYHLLNHLNLFGVGWLSQVQSTAQGVLNN